MLFLYKSYASLNRSNIVYEQAVTKIDTTERLKKTIYLDLTAAINKSIKITNQDTKEDVLFFQTTHSVHKRINPYVVYLVNNKILYRLESFKKITEFPLAADSEFVVDRLGKVKIFRVYKAKDKKSNSYLVHILFESDVEILLKVALLN